MEKQIGKSIARNFSIMFGARAITWISSFVLLMFLPRYLGSEDYGRLYLAMSVKMMIGLFIDFGGNYLITKEVARSEEQGVKMLNSYFMLRIVLWLISMGGVILASHLFGYSQYVHILILILTVGKLFEGESKALKAYFQGIERTEFPSIGMVAERISIAAFAVAALLLGADSIAIAVIMALATIINLVVVAWFSRDFINFEFQLDKRVFSLLRSGLPFFLYSLFSIIYYRIDAIMLSSMTTDEVTGWYGGAYRFFDIVMVFPMVYTKAVFPIFSKLWDDKEGLLEETLGQSLKLILLLAIPVSIGIFLFSEPIIHFFMGLGEYRSSVVILKIFAASIPLIYMDFILGSAIMGAANRQKGWAIVGFLAIFINVGINFYLIPFTQTIFANGGIGAAVATFITELFIMLSAVWLLPKSYFQNFEVAYVYKPLTAGLVMAAFIWFMFSTGIYWMILLACGGLLYLGMIWSLKIFSPREMELIKKMASVNKIKMLLSNKI